MNYYNHQNHMKMVEYLSELVVCVDSNLVSSRTIYHIDHTNPLVLHVILNVVREFVVAKTIYHNYQTNNRIEFFHEWIERVVSNDCSDQTTDHIDHIEMVSISNELC